MQAHAVFVLLLSLLPSAYNGCAVRELACTDKQNSNASPPQSKEEKPALHTTKADMRSMLSGNFPFTFAHE
jgi:hypothetical protein